MSYYWPMSMGEHLGFAVAAVTLMLGLAALLSPHAGLAMTRLQPRPDAPDAIAEVRSSLAGPMIGIGGAAIVLAQPLLMLALGASWGAAALGRLLSMVVDRSASRFNAATFLFEAAMAAAALAGPLGYVA